MLDSRPLLIATDFPPIRRNKLEILQVNLGYKCNLSCVHCHVNAGPTRTEMMSLETVELLLQFIKAQQIKVLDLTGGAPELNPHFRYLVAQARALGVEVIDRCNLTVLLEPGQEGLAEFLAQQQVVITASLPCYSAENVEKQRGKGVYADSIKALQQLNQLGYGSDPKLALHLVYNPTGPVLPPPQQALEAAYKKELQQRHQIVFNQLYTITNMPISRFGAVLLSQGQFEAYMDLLKANFSDSNLATVMCKNLLSVDWQGYLYDCDFNQMLALPMGATAAQGRRHLSSVMRQDFAGLEIHIADHCFGCTAGQGSSCGGALHD
ncbi:arsenosugar biosynthesis radical SAM protein ArsS [Dasania sp. GY-MA-18]|uniref:Arsenosugar biosynthesis radical SAM protein ArsS n=1 Tax=Dasania phycosphaerae TaxID=2950436 RepID=A0A9J6RIM3_9GAMM|nr:MULTISPECIES: arsenosugar biosynthesis radical SAM (seleno)protein ArsS [Dasania]MCR8921409.1 arsenosugar biosynthesis radical SAM protein ArsS [Dasania sp. GY-MA-18]MCZ0863837.1 arsenosugar biosynthesis radical SAM protein ArsS [Dasania phycosphaerae]MCZ0867565.1 arsenosugar biosynthesis radical SAM protein ArsS [Dasania phycosphaerae]